jgi:predicted ATPase with chaperone activity
VSLEDYIGRTHAQSVRGIQIAPADLNQAFVDLVLDIRVLNQLGTAISSGRALFLYGPSGTGKTTIAETLMRLFENDPIWLPYAVEVDSQIITVYDAVVHKRVDQAPTAEQDGRWVLCHRPRLMVGGELTIEMLDLQFNPSTKFYNGPVQMKANNGLLVVDDFGRQRVSPEELLNRWWYPWTGGLTSSLLPGARRSRSPSISSSSSPPTWTLPK